MSDKVNLDKAAIAYDAYFKMPVKAQNTWLSKRWIHSDLTLSTKSKVIRFLEKVPFIRCLHRFLFGINFKESCRRMNQTLKKLNIPTPLELKSYISSLNGLDQIKKLNTMKSAIKASALTSAYYNNMKVNSKGINTQFTQWNNATASKAIRTLAKKISEIETTPPGTTPEICGILCIDGGGVRGLIPAIILTKFEEIAQTPISKLFPVMGGASIGGLLVSGYATPNEQNTQKYTAQQIVTIFKQLAINVFPKESWWDPLPGWSKPAYSRAPLQKSCNEFFGSTLYQNGLSEIHIPVADVPNRKARFLRSYKTGKKNPDLQTQDVVFATTSAPTYFPLYPLKLGDKTILAGDGGIFANNPTPSVFLDVKKRYPEKELIIVSIATGNGDGKLEAKDVEDAGKLYWADKISPEIMDITANMNHRLMLNQVAGKPRYRYFRFEMKLDPKYGALNNASPEAIAYYEKVAAEMITKHLKDIKMICELLKPST